MAARTAGTAGLPGWTRWISADGPMTGSCGKLCGLRILPVENRMIPDMINFCPPGSPGHGPEGVAKPGMFSKYGAGRSFLYSRRHGAPRPYPRANWSVVQTGLRGSGWETCHVPRRTWLDSKIDVFLEELAASCGARLLELAWTDYPAGIIAE
jgi:hypothetical protein